MLPSCAIALVIIRRSAIAEQACGSIYVANVGEMSVGACDWCVRDARIARAGAVLVLSELVGHGGHDWSAGGARKVLCRLWCDAELFEC